MSVLARTGILSKLIAIIALIAVIVGGCVLYAQSRMTVIDNAYSQLIDREAKATVSVRRANRLIIELNYWVYRIIAETEDAQMQSASAGFEAAVPQVRKTMADLRDQSPTFADRI